MLTAAGRWIFAATTIAFGVEYLIFGYYLGGLPPMPPWAPGGAAGAYLVGILLVGAGLSMGSGFYARWSAIFVGVWFSLSVLFLHLLHANDVVHSGNDRTRALETLALGAAALVLAGMRPASRGVGAEEDASSAKLIAIGRWLFAFTLVIFGVQHFMYAQFIATLVTAWIPGHLFFVYFTGVAMIAAGLAIALKILGYWGALGMAAMFLSWVLVLHGPRVMASLHNKDEWSSLFVALGMGGASLIIASAMAKKT